jgi:hypothetical protein
MSLASKAKSVKSASLPKRLRRAAQGTLSKLAHTNITIAKAYHNRQTARQERRRRGPPLLIYTMGKVGSSSILYSLRQLKLDRPLYHLHSLAQDSLCELEASLAPAFPNPQTMVSLQHVWRCQFVAQRLANSPEKTEAISLIRDPIARNISNFFQHIHVEPLPALSGERRWKLASSFHDFQITAGEHDMSELIELYFAREWHDFPPFWVDRELEGILGIDVYASPFPRTDGYAIYESDRARLLLIRLQDLDRCASQALCEFLGLDQFALVNANVAEEKAYVDVYQAFKAAITFPQTYLEQMYSSRLVEHFYGPAEIQAFRDRWSERRA